MGFQEYETELTAWLDARMKFVVDQGNTDLMADINSTLDTRFAGVTAMLNDESKDIASVSGSVSALIVSALQPITLAIQKITSFIPI